MKIKRLAAFFMSAAMIFSVSAVFSSCSDKSDDDKVLTVGFDAEFPPYGFKDDSGEYVGLDLDLAQAVCDKRGWKLEKRPIDWDSKDLELKTGQIDCIWNGFTINGRENDYTWSAPYFDNAQVMVVRADSGIDDTSDLSGRIVAVQADSSGLAALTGDDATEENKALAESFEELQQVGDYNSAFLNLDSGVVDAICMDVGVAKYEISQRDTEYIVLDEHISSEQYGIGFYKGNTELRDQVQETLMELLDDGTINKIAAKWDLEDAVCLTEDSEVIDPTEDKEKSFSELFTYVCKELAKGMGASFAIFFFTLLFALPLGLFIAFGRMSRFFILRTIMKVYISIVRGTPLMLQLLLVFFGPNLLFGIKLSSNYRLYAVLIGFILNYAAYFAEIYRAGIQAVPKGQHEAAAILGYSKGMAFRKIVFPQMMRTVIPAITNEVITLVKDTSLAFAIAYTEMFTIAKQVAAAESTILPIFIAGLFYYVFNVIVAAIMARIEQKLSHY